MAFSCLSSSEDLNFSQAMSCGSNMLPEGDTRPDIDGMLKEYGMGQAMDTGETGVTGVACG